MYEWSDLESHHSSAGACLGFQSCHQGSIVRVVLSSPGDVIQTQTQTSVGVVGDVLLGAEARCVGKLQGFAELIPTNEGNAGEGLPSTDRIRKGVDSGWEMTSGK